jgi:hypothetical protein
MNKVLLCALLAAATIVSSARPHAAEPEPAPTAASLVQKFQDLMEAEKGYLRRPFDDLTTRYRDALTHQQKEYEKAGNAAGAQAATEALQSLAAGTLETPSKDAAVETLRSGYATERKEKLTQLAPKVQAMLTDYPEKLKKLIAALVERDFTDEALAMSARSEQIRAWLSTQPAGQPFSDEVVLCLLAKGPPALNGVVSWGDNAKRQATVPPKLFGIVGVAAGMEHSLALKYDGTVNAWGSNENGQTQVPAGLCGVVAIAAGEKHSLALKADGTVVAWGYNKEKQCEVPADLKQVKAISSHCWHSLALKTDGTVIAWGRRANGALDVPTDLKDVVQISAGGAHNLALKADGTVVAWGLNDAGQTNVPEGLNQVIAVAAGHFHSLALKSDGTVVGWGMNNYGQVRIPRDLAHVTAIAAQGWHSSALTADGRVVAWGFKTRGQTNVPQDLAHATAISSGTYHILAIAPTKD